MKRKTSDPPASLDGPVLRVFGEFQHVHTSLSIVRQTQEAPEGEREPVHRTASAPTRSSSETHSPTLCYNASPLNRTAQSCLPGLDVYEAVDELHVV